MPAQLVLVKHALPIPDPSLPARDWRLGDAGESQSLRLADVLRRFLPFRLVSSGEPKVARTAEVVAGRLSLDAEVVDGLEEIDRPVLPWMGTEEHQAFNKRLFDEFEDAVVGQESARDALHRFETTIGSICDRSGDTNVVAITHGTVMSLLAAQHNREIDGFDIWKDLRCPAFIVFALPSLAVNEIVPEAVSGDG